MRMVAKATVSVCVCVCVCVVRETERERERGGSCLFAVQRVTEPSGYVHGRGCAVEPERSVRQRGGATEFENARETRTERLYV